MNQHQQIAFEAAIEINNICKEYDIECFILAGSVLGAVRHKGFIPWDDDIDIGIKYSDLHKFNKISNKLPSKYKYVSIETCDKYPRFNGKVLCEGISCVDIFPLIKLSNNNIISSIQWNAHRIMVHILFRKMKYEPIDENKKYKFFSQILSIFFTKKSTIKLDNFFMKLKKKKKTEWYSNITSKYSFKKEKIKTEWIEHPEELEFEGIKFLSPGNTHDYLTNLYRNYMELPPVNERIPVHEESFSYLFD